VTSRADHYRPNSERVSDQGFSSAHSVRLHLESWLAVSGVSSKIVLDLLENLERREALLYRVLRCEPAMHIPCDRQRANGHAWACWRLGHGLRPLELWCPACLEALYHAHETRGPRPAAT
jgi:hypothetical protein